MADEADRAGEAIEREAAQRLARLRDQQPTGASATHCDECGDVIPEPRRAAIAGCRECVGCAERAEQRARQYRTG